jgi:hypothetical protein
MKDFWASCGHHLLERDQCGRLQATDEFIKLYLARPELAPLADACVVERTLHAALLSDPWRPVLQAEIDAIADADARENWQHMVAFRDHLAANPTLETAYTVLVRRNARVPPLFMDQLVHVILRNALDQCADAYVLRAAELLYRPQRLAVHNGALLAADQEYVDNDAPAVSPLAAMFGFPEQQNVEVLSNENAEHYWDRSDRFDLALDLTASRRGLAALAIVMTRWIKHLLDIDVAIEPLKELRNAALTWYVGLDVHGTKIGDTLWNGAELDDAARNSLVGLFRMTFLDPGRVLERIAGEPTYLILAMGPDRVLRMKPQNLLTGLPVRDLEPAA